MLYALLWLFFCLFVCLPWSQEMTFYILIMAVAHISVNRKKKWKLWFFLKLWNFFKFSKKIKIFIFSPVHSYVLRPWWGYKKLFPDFKEAKKTNNKSKYDWKLHFFYFFSQANSKNWHQCLQNANFCYVTKKTKTSKTLEQLWYLYHFHSSKTKQIREVLVGTKPTKWHVLLLHTLYR